MKYEDFLTPTEQEFRIMRQRYMQEAERETGDLQEILQKMKTQKDYLQRNNTNQKYTKIIDKLTDNIAELNSLIISNQSHFLRKYSRLNENNPINLGEAISPIRHIDENLLSQPNEIPSNTPNDINNLPLDNNDISTPNTPFIPNNNNGNDTSPTDNSLPTPNENTDNTNQSGNATPPRTNTMKRNCPKQSHTLFDAFRQVNVNLSRIFGGLSHKKMKATTHSPHSNKNRWHIAPPNDEDNYTLQTIATNNKVISEECKPQNVLLHNQIDIIRLFLLYLMLRPNCKYLSTITTIANSQFDIMLELM